MYLQQLLYKLKRPFHFVKTGLFNGLPARLRFRQAKKLKIITITGTDGKTTSTSLLYHVLKTAGLKTGLISTIKAVYDGEEIKTGFHVTAPQPKQLYALLAKMQNKGADYVVLEMTSHGAYQFRDWGIAPLIAGVTNINSEHLDYHLNYENYLEAKFLHLKKAKLVILNADDQSAYYLRQKLQKQKKYFESYSASDRIHHELKKAIEKNFPEEYNQMNARLVIAIARKLKIENKTLIAAFDSFKGIEGRMQLVENDKNLNVYVDFAHTPQGVEAALTALKKKQKKGKLIAVLGAAGLRDFGKRPIMGKLAAELADFLILTSEDPRTEDPWAIIQQMKQDVGRGLGRIASVVNRKDAIHFAITQIAKKGDTIAILGKGHEESFCIGKVEYPWSDSKIASQILETL